MARAEDPGERVLDACQRRSINLRRVGRRHQN